jgi:hypothetical protein
MPGRKFPGIVIQGDTLFSLIQGLRMMTGEFKKAKNEEGFYEALGIAEILQSHLLHYEEVLVSRGSILPYSGSVSTNPIVDDFDDTEA